MWIVAIETAILGRLMLEFHLFKRVVVALQAERLARFGEQPLVVRSMGIVATGAVAVLDRIMLELERGEEILMATKARVDFRFFEDALVIGGMRIVTILAIACRGRMFYLGLGIHILVALDA